MTDGSQCKGARLRASTWRPDWRQCKGARPRASTWRPDWRQCKGARPRASTWRPDWRHQRRCRRSSSTVAASATAARAGRLAGRGTAARIAACAGSAKGPNPYVLRALSLRLSTPQRQPTAPRSPPLRSAWQQKTVLMMDPRPLIRTPWGGRVEGIASSSWLRCVRGRFWERGREREREKRETRCSCSPFHHHPAALATLNLHPSHPNTERK